MLNYKTIFSLRLRIALQQKGFEPLYERDNKTNKQLKCWIYLDTPEFQQVLEDILRGESNG